MFTTNLAENHYPAILPDSSSRWNTSQPNSVSTCYQQMKQCPDIIESQTTPNTYQHPYHHQTIYQYNYSNHNYYQSTGENSAELLPNNKKFECRASNAETMVANTTLSKAKMEKRATSRKIKTAVTSSRSRAYDNNKENSSVSEQLNSSGCCSQQTSTNAATVYPAFFTTQKAPINKDKLKYTPYQLELLNAIYMEIDYPNCNQKTLIAQVIGIKREQLKIWFQNRRRKDTLLSQGKITQPATTRSKRKSNDESNDNYDETESSPPEMENKKPQVSEDVINKILDELKFLRGGPSRLSTKRPKLSCSESQNENSSPKTDLQNINRVSTTIDQTKFPNGNVTFKQPIETSLSLSSTCTASSSEEELSNYQRCLKQQPTSSCFSELQQPMQIQDYLKQSYANYQRYPKLHNNVVLQEVPPPSQISTTISSSSTSLPYTTQSYASEYKPLQTPDLSGYYVQPSVYSSGTISNGVYGGGGVISEKSGATINACYTATNQHNPHGYLQTNMAQTQYFYNPSEQHHTPPQYNTFNYSS